MPDVTAHTGCTRVNESRQHAASHCNTMQHTTTHHNTLQHTASHCIALQHTAIHCNPMQHTAHCTVCRSWYMLQYVAVCCSVLQYVAVCCSILQYLAVCQMDRRTYKWVTSQIHISQPSRTCENDVRMNNITHTNEWCRKKACIIHLSETISLLEIKIWRCMDSAGAQNA